MVRALPPAAAASYAELGADLDRCLQRLPTPGSGERVKYVLIGLLRAYRLADQPALRPGLPLPPVLLGVRPGGGDRARQPARQLAGRAPPARAATRGPPAATTPFPPRPRRHARLTPPKEPDPCDFLGDIGHFIMTPLYYAISAVLVGLALALRAWCSTPTAVPPGCCRSSA